MIIIKRVAPLFKDVVVVVVVDDVAVAVAVICCWFKISPEKIKIHHFYMNFLQKKKKEIDSISYCSNV